MNFIKNHLAIITAVLVIVASSCSGNRIKTIDIKKSTASELETDFKKPPFGAKPWVFWYWMQASVSKEGITADLEAMKDLGIGGAYLMPIKGVKNPPYMEPYYEQLTPEWWDMVRHSMSEADRLGLKIAMHGCDGFALAGGPWITPEMSMQKVVWTKTYVNGKQNYNDTLPQPESYEGYYKDIAVFAYPTPDGKIQSSYTTKPKVTTSNDVDSSFLLVVPNNKKVFRSNEPSWIQYEFDEPFTCRSVVVRIKGNNYQSQRLRIEASNDGRKFKLVQQMQPPRHGWQNTDADVTHSIPPTTAKYFRFVYNNAGSEPGAEDLDAAKWRQNLRLLNIELTNEPFINQHEGKTAQVWRLSKRTTKDQIPNELCIPMDKMINITSNLDKNGKLSWNVPDGNWTILRMGHTSTGHMNETAGKGKGLECDKFNPKAVQLQFDNWFGEAQKQIGEKYANEILKVFHIDSWECGSQNWSDNLTKEFKKRRGYDLKPYLPLMAGIPINNVTESEQVLHDLRQTITELVTDIFYVTLRNAAHKTGCEFSAECVSPTMMSDGMLHYQNVDIPMGEFWLLSPTHDKPNDMLDAISAAHIYGKPIIQAEGYTQIRMDWTESPAALKALGDRVYALGINRMAYHVWAHNPFMDRKPGMTLDGIGLYLQRDQTWLKPGRAWVQYAQRVQAALQHGVPVTDIAVFTGEETPRRAILPERLVNTFPGIVGKEMVQKEKTRLANIGEPIRELPIGVWNSANMADPENYVDILRGYQYDSFNKDALIRLAKVENGRIVLPGGGNYAMLVLPQHHQMKPDSGYMTKETLSKLYELVQQGATILISDRPQKTPSKNTTSMSKYNDIVKELYDGEFTSQNGLLVKNIGKGRVIKTPITTSNFDAIGLERDIIVSEKNIHAKDIAWTHRKGEDFDIYFISNQKDQQRTINVSLRKSGYEPELWDAVTGEMRVVLDWKSKDGRTNLPIRLEPSGSIFIVLRKPANDKEEVKAGNNWANLIPLRPIKSPWFVQFDPSFGGPKEVQKFIIPADWSRNYDKRIKYYSGTAVYNTTFHFNHKVNKRIFLDLGKVVSIAEVRLNGKECGVAWTTPFHVEITDAIKQGENKLTIEVSNTWRNKLAEDNNLPEDKRQTWTNAPWRYKNKPLSEAGLIGPIQILTEK